MKQYINVRMTEVPDNTCGVLAIDSENNNKISCPLFDPDYGETKVSFAHMMDDMMKAALPHGQVWFDVFVRGYKIVGIMANINKCEIVGFVQKD